MCTCIFCGSPEYANNVKRVNSEAKKYDRSLSGIGHFFIQKQSYRNDRLHRLKHNQTGGESMSNKVIKSVSLNVTNADDAAILKAVKRRNFSGYVKGLILADLRSKEAAGVNTPAELPKPQNAAQRLEALKQKGEQRPAPKVFLNQGRN
jgi:hypothetical protein